MPLVVPGVARFAVNQTLEGRAVVNVLDYFIDTTGSTMSRDDAVFAQAGDIITQWAGLINGFQVDDLTFDSVSFVDMNASDGTTGSRSSSDSVTLPEAGGITDQPLPANTAYLVTKQVQSARGRRNGRMFLAGPDEAATQAGNGNLLEAVRISQLNANLAAFLENTNNVDSVGTAFSSEMVVVSVTARDGAGNPVSGIGTAVQSLVCDDLLATQRRRLRG